MYHQTNDIKQNLILKKMEKPSSNQKFSIKLTREELKQIIGGTPEVCASGTWIVCVCNTGPYLCDVANGVQTADQKCADDCIIVGGMRASHCSTISCYH